MIEGTRTILIVSLHEGPLRTGLLPGRSQPSNPETISRYGLSRGTQQSEFAEALQHGWGNTLRVGRTHVVGVHLGRN